MTEKIRDGKGAEQKTGKNMVKEENKRNKKRRREQRKEKAIETSEIGTY